MFLKFHFAAHICRTTIFCVSLLSLLFAPLENAATMQNWLRELDQVLRGEKRVFPIFRKARSGSTRPD